MRRILVVEDDPAIGNMLEEILEKAGYGVWHAWSGTEAMLLCSRRRPDLILLDLMLPGLSGEEVLRRIKGIPVIVLSAKAEVDHKVSLLLDGASDYMTKPFDPRELLARIQVAFRSFPEGEKPILSVGDLRLDPERCTISRIEKEGSLDGDSPPDGDSLPNGDSPPQAHLTRTECAVLKLLMQNPSQVIPRTRLLDRMSQDTPDGTEASLKIHISNIRRKLRGIGCKAQIEAVWGIGFLFHGNPAENQERNGGNAK